MKKTTVPSMVPSILMAGALLLAGCGSGDGGQGGAQATPDRLVVDVKIAGGDVTPTNAQLEATVNEPIVFRVDSDAADELHVHSTPEHSYKIEAKPGQSFQFTVAVPGQVDVELHELNKTVATITVR